MNKYDVNDLALLGGTPLFQDALHVGRPNVGDRLRFLERVDAMFDRRWLTNNGPNVVEFERRICDVTGAPHCIAVCNATIGLELVIRAFGLTGEVIVPAFTFVATAHALSWLGVQPVFCDVDPKTHTIDPKSVEAMITPRTSAIIGVHTWGRGCDIPSLADLANRRGLKLIYDAAHAFACGTAEGMVGAFGDAEVFSFHATKFLNSFEGGAITTRDPALADRLRRMRNFGFAGLDSVTSTGTNGKMTEISAAMGLTSLESMDTFIDVNRRNYGIYRREISAIDGLSLYEFPDEVRSNYQYVVAEVDPARTGLTRDTVVDLLIAEGVLARRYFYPGIHRMAPYGSGAAAPVSLPVTDALVQRVMQLPTGTAMPERNVTDVCDLLRFICRQSGDILHRMNPERLHCVAS